MPRKYNKIIEAKNSSNTEGSTDTETYSNSASNIWKATLGMRVLLVSVANSLGVEVHAVRGGANKLVK